MKAIQTRAGARRKSTATAVPNAGTAAAVTPSAVTTVADIMAEVPTPAVRMATAVPDGVILPVIIRMAVRTAQWPIAARTDISAARPGIAGRVAPAAWA